MKEQKPSDKIYDLYSKKRLQEDPAHATLMAICDYLDETIPKLEKLLPCEHDWEIWNDMYRCRKCQILD